MFMCVAPLHPHLTSNPHLEQERVKDLHKRLQAEHLLRWGGVHSASAQAACAECVVQLAVAEQLQSLQP